MQGLWSDWSRDRFGVGEWGKIGRPDWGRELGRLEQWPDWGLGELGQMGAGVRLGDWGQARVGD